MDEKEWIAKETCAFRRCYSVVRSNTLLMPLFASPVEKYTTVTEIDVKAKLELIDRVRRD